MPLTKKGHKIEEAMEKEYGEKKGKSVFYASKNKGTIKGVEDKSPKSKALHTKMGKREHERGGYLRKISSKSFASE